MSGLGFYRYANEDNDLDTTFGESGAEAQTLFIFFT